MPEYRFSLTQIFLYKDKIYNYILSMIESKKTFILEYFMQCNSQKFLYFKKQRNVTCAVNFLVSPKCHASNCNK